MDEAIQDGIGVSRVSYDAVPCGYGKLAGDDRGSTAIAIFEDFQQVVAGLFVERLEPPIIQYQELNMAQGSLQPGVAAITTRERKLGKQPWDTLIEN
ncbi:hypothetical protein FB001_1551 [Ensifer sp. SEMIA 135]|nr:hypothetical protein FB001_1551 [Ensifer sp. SEMIA 135]